MSRKLLPIEPFSAIYKHIPDDDAPAEWRPCQVVGISPSEFFSPNPGFVVIASHNGTITPIEVRDVRKVPA